MSQPTNGHAPRARATDADAQIGALLRRHRIAHGWTQAQMGELMGVTYQQLHKYEAGKNRLSAGALLQLLATLGIGLDAFAAEFAAERPSTKPGPKMSATARRVHERVARLSTAQQRSVLGMLEALTDHAHQA